VIEDACFTYACACAVKTAPKPAQPRAQRVHRYWHRWSWASTRITCRSTGKRKCLRGMASSCPIKRCAAGWRNARSCWNLY